MSTAELMKEIQKLPIDKRLLVVQRTLLSIQKSEQQRMKKAAEVLRREYSGDSHLTAFTILDSEPFYELR